jgi:hypothetical protein
MIDHGRSLPKRAYGRKMPNVTRATPASVTLVIWGCAPANDGNWPVNAEREQPTSRVLNGENESGCGHSRRDRAMTAGNEQGLSTRCEFHERTIDTLPADGLYNAVTALLVSHYLGDRAARKAFFRALSGKLRSGGILINADLSAEIEQQLQQGQNRDSCR